MNEELERSCSGLKQGGVLVSIVAPLSPEHAAHRGAHGIFFVGEPDRGILIELAGSYRCRPAPAIIALVMPLARAGEAYSRGSVGHTRTKIVSTVAGARQDTALSVAPPISEGQ